MKRHSVCKRHVAIDTGFKQTERTIFLHVILMGLKLQLLPSTFLKKLLKVSIAEQFLLGPSHLQLEQPPCKRFEAEITNQFKQELDTYRKEIGVVRLKPSKFAHKT